MKELRRHKVSVLGDSYTFVSDESGEAFFLALARVENVLQSLSVDLSCVSKRQVFLLVALRLSSQLNAYEEARDSDQKKGQDLLDALDEEFKSLGCDLVRDSSSGGAGEDSDCFVGDVDLKLD